MSGSRGEANFVWRCKNCKVFFILLSAMAVNSYKETSLMYAIA